MEIVNHTQTHGRREKDNRNQERSPLDKLEEAKKTRMGEFGGDGWRDQCQRLDKGSPQTQEKKGRREKFRRR